MRPRLVASALVCAGALALAAAPLVADGAPPGESVAEETVERIETTADRLGARAEELWRRMPLYGIALGILLASALLARLLGEWTFPFRLVSASPLIRGILAQVAATGVFLLGALAALELLDATALVGAVLGAAGVVGLAIGFAFRDIAENYLASILLGLRRPFAADDHVVIDVHEGLVVRLTTRETILLSLDGNHVRLPNALVYKSAIVNYTRNPLRRFAFAAGIGNEERLARAQRVGVEALRRVPGVAADPGPFARVEALADSNVVVRYFAWVDQREADWFKVRSEAVRRVKESLDAEGIDMPVPTTRVLTQAASSATPRAAREDPTPVEPIAPDDVLERQIRRDRVDSEEEDLLDEPA